MLDVACPSCGETYHVDEAHVGRSVRCRRCDRVFEITGPSGTGPSAGTRPAPHARTAGAAGPAQATQGGDQTTQATPAGYTEPIAVSDADFDRAVLRSSHPVVVDFWAAWCGPCRAIAPAIEQLAQEYGGRVTFAKLNADENPRAMSRYGVMGLPTLVFFKQGQEMGRLVGAQPKAAIKRAVDQIAAG